MDKVVQDFKDSIQQHQLETANDLHQIITLMIKHYPETIDSFEFELTLDNLKPFLTMTMDNRYFMDLFQRFYLDPKQKLKIKNYSYQELADFFPANDLYTSQQLGWLVRHTENENLIELLKNRNKDLYDFMRPSIELYQ